jgi:hypothetical protein
VVEVEVVLVVQLEELAALAVLAVAVMVVVFQWSHLLQEPLTLAVVVVVVKDLLIPQVIQLLEPLAVQE